MNDTQEYNRYTQYVCKNVQKRREMQDVVHDLLDTDNSERTEDNRRSKSQWAVCMENYRRHLHECDIYRRVENNGRYLREN